MLRREKALTRDASFVLIFLRREYAFADPDDGPVMITRDQIGEFLRAYRETIAARPDLLPGSEETQMLLDAYLLEKALYELLYELNNRPAWLHIPIAGILNL